MNVLKWKACREKKKTSSALIVAPFCEQREEKREERVHLHSQITQYIIYLYIIYIIE